MCETRTTTATKANKYLYRRVEIRDVVDAHLLASESAPAIGFRKYIISATTPFLPEDLPELRVDTPRVVRRRVPGYEAEYGRRGWRMFPGIDRVYVNRRARDELAWRPRYDFEFVLDRLMAGDDPRSPLARAIGSKGYHAGAFFDGPYPVEKPLIGVEPFEAGGPARAGHGGPVVAATAGGTS